MKNELIDFHALSKKLKTEQQLMQGGVFTESDTGKQYFTGYAYKTLYDWDQYFEAIVQIYMGWEPKYIINAIEIFLDYQLDDGFVARSVPGNKGHNSEHVKPFLAQMAMLVNDYYGDLSWLQGDYYNKLKKYLDCWLFTQDKNQNGLSEWMSAPHTGMDNQHERAGHWFERISEGVDLNSYLVREAQAFSSLAKILGHNNDADFYQLQSQHRIEAINEKLWDEDDGFYYDLHFKTSQQIKVKSIAGLMPLWAGVASKQQAERLVKEHLTNPAEFWATWPVAVLARSEKGYSQSKLPGDIGQNWRANTWMPTNYMIYHGLKRYGYNDIATELANKTDELMKKSGNREYFNSETGQGCNLDPFWGWTLLGHFIKLEDENHVSR